MARFEIPAQLASRATVTFDMSRERLQRMVDLSAPYTSPRGNRRYGDYVFRVIRGTVEEIGYAPVSRADIKEDADAQG